MSDVDTTTDAGGAASVGPTRRPLLRAVVMLGVLVAVAVATFAAQGQGDDAAPGEPAGTTAQPANTGGEAGSADTAAAESELSDQPLYRIGQLYGFSPIINGLIVALSVIALMFFLWFMVTINNRTMVPSGLIDELMKLILRGEYERASDACRVSRGVFVADVAQRCLENPTQQHAIMLDMIDIEGRRKADILWNRVSYLADISNVAPMLGLLGTVLGMIKVFSELKFTSGSISAQLLAGGVGEAMSTTMFGLSVGIFATVLYAVVKSRATRTLADAEQAVHMIADHIKRDQPDVVAVKRVVKKRTPRRRATDKATEKRSGGASAAEAEDEAEADDDELDD